MPVHAPDPGSKAFGQPLELRGPRECCVHGFLSLFLLFVRFLPMIAMAEVKGVVAGEKAHGEVRS